MDAGVWPELYRTLAVPRKERIVTGFNVNLDRSIPVTGELLASLPVYAASLPGFMNRFRLSLGRSVADELFVPDAEEFRRFAGNFMAAGSLSIGGQAGIAAVHLAASGAPSVLCVAPAMGDETRRLLEERGVGIPGPRISEACPDSIHLVFEYAPGLISPEPGFPPRRNRFIVSPVHGAESALLGPDLLEAVKEAAVSCNRFFLSGYQYLRTEREFAAAAGQLAEIRGQNPDLRIHAEWVGVTDRELNGRFLRYILPRADSLGINEQELLNLSSCLHPGGHSGGNAAPSPPELIREAVGICRATGLRRLHVHTHGYYILVLDHPVDPGASRDALLYASREAARSAGPGPAGLVPAGIAAMASAEDRFGRDGGPGIFSLGGYCGIMVPSLVTEGEVRTVGLGDRISSLAFDTDPC